MLIDVLDVDDIFIEIVYLNILKKKNDIVLAIMLYIISLKLLKIKKF